MPWQQARVFSADAAPRTGRITLGGVEPSMNTLVRNTVAQVFVQAFIDLVRACCVRNSEAGW